MGVAGCQAGRFQGSRETTWELETGTDQEPNRRNRNGNPNRWNRNRSRAGPGIHGIPWNSWNSMESMEFHGIHGIPWIPWNPWDTVWLCAEPHSVALCRATQCGSVQSHIVWLCSEPHSVALH